MFRPMRRFKQALSEEECLEVLKEGKRGTLALAGDDGYPYALPINYYFDPDSRRIYFHGAGEGHKIDAIQRCDKVSFCVHDDGVKLEGDWAYTVRSVIWDLWHLRALNFTLRFRSTFLALNRPMSR